jgi:hypothetical protein
MVATKEIGNVHGNEEEKVSHLYNGGASGKEESGTLSTLNDDPSRMKIQLVCAERAGKRCVREYSEQFEIEFSPEKRSHAEIAK